MLYIKKHSNFFKHDDRASRLHDAMYFAIRFSLTFKLPLILCGITWICFHRPLLDLMAIGTQAA